LRLSGERKLDKPQTSPKWPLAPFNHCLASPSLRGHLKYHQWESTSTGGMMPHGHVKRMGQNAIRRVAETEEVRLNKGRLTALNDDPSLDVGLDVHGFLLSLVWEHSRPR
jgi:hypothetical protein